MDETKRSKQEALDKRYIRMASIWAENSYCQRRQVGALIVKDKMIISDGYNGTPSGFENVCVPIVYNKRSTIDFRRVKLCQQGNNSQATNLPTAIFCFYFPLFVSLINISNAAVIEGACTVGASKSRRRPASRTACAVVEPKVPILISF